MHLANAMRQQSIGGTHVSGNQSFYGAPPGDLDNSLRQQRTEDNHISINGQIYSVDGTNVNVGVEGHDLKRDAQMKCGGSLSIDESPMGNIGIDCGGSLNINKSQMESSQIDVGGSIGIVESPMGSIGIDCGGPLRIEKTKIQLATWTVEEVHPLLNQQREILNTKREEKQKVKPKQHTFGLNIGGNSNVGGTQKIGGIKIGGKPTGGSFSFNTGGNRNVGGTREIGSAQGPYNRSNSGDMANSLRQQCTEENHISINGQIYSVDGTNVNVGVEGHDLKRDAQMKCGGSLSIDESPMGNIGIDCGGSLNINKSQMESSQIDVGGSIGIVESPMGSIGIDCGGPLRIEKTKIQLATWTVEEVHPLLNQQREILNMANSLRQQCTEENHISINGQIYSVDGTNVNVGVEGHDLKRDAQMKCGGSLSIDESPMGNIGIDCGGSLNINKSQMESSQIDVGGSIGIVESPMGSIGIDCGGPLRIEKTKIQLATWTVEEVHPLLNQQREILILQREVFELITVEEELIYEDK
ncbi:hypothetical protein niasHT_018576 [Heterodera trifolii]|uniref:Uncharacterized protein n=1 Tax=Heterodera trifolii TaxID=157864 RepID=A0ABD2LBF8_9BILA